MTTATVAIQQSENLSRFPTPTTPAPHQSTSASRTTPSTPWITLARMNETQQMHATDSSQQSNTSLHNNNNNNNNNSSTGKNRSSNSNSDAKMDHHFQLLQREREQQRERDQQQQQQQHQQSSSSASATMSQSQSHHQQQQHQRDQRDQHQREHQHRPFSPTPSEQQQYALKWNDFQSSILSSFRHLRDEEDFVDVTIACEQRSFTAHKVSCDGDLLITP